MDLTRMAERRGHKFCGKGKTRIRGKVGAGFHPMLTGRENVYTYGAILDIVSKPTV